MTDRVLVNTYGSNPHGIRLALAEAHLLSHKLKCSVVICVLDKKTVGSTVLNEVISPGHINKIVRGLSIQLTPTVTATMESVRTIGTQRGPTIVVALFAVPEMMKTIDAMPDCEAVIMVPSIEEYGKIWREEWDARVIPVA